MFIELDLHLFVMHKYCVGAMQSIRHFDQAHALMICVGTADLQFRAIAISSQFEWIGANNSILLGADPHRSEF